MDTYRIGVTVLISVEVSADSLEEAIIKSRQLVDAATQKENSIILLQEGDCFLINKRRMTNGVVTKS